MLSFVFRKIIEKKWMFLSLLIGNLLMIAIAAAGPMYSNAVLQRTLTQDLSNYLVETNRYPGTIHIKQPTYSKTDLQLVDATGAEFFGMADELSIPTLAEVTRYGFDKIIASPEVIVSGEKDRLIIELAAYSDFADHIEILQGEMYSTEMQGKMIEVVVSEKTFMDQNLTIGKVLDIKQVEGLEGYQLKVVGIFKNKDDQDPYWLTWPSYWDDTFLMDETLMRSLIGTFEAEGKACFEEWHMVLDYTKFRADQVGTILKRIEEQESAYNGAYIQVSRVNFRNTLEDFLVTQRKLNSTILVLQIPIFVLLAAFIFMVSRQMLDIEKNEIAIFKSRGASKRQIIGIYLLQSILVAAVGILGGVPLGVFLCKLIGASDDFLSFVQRTSLPVEIVPQIWAFAGAAALFSVCTMVLPVISFANVTIVAYKQSKMRTKQRTWWKLFGLDIILLGLSIYGLFSFRSQEAYLAQQMMDGAALDPVLYLCSSLFMLGAALLFLRLLPLMIRFVFWVGKKVWSPALYASFLRILRTNQNQGFLIVFLTLTITIGVFNARMAKTINTNSEERIRYSIGADVVLQDHWSSNSEEVLADSTGMLELTYTEPDYGKYLQMDGIEKVTKVLSDNKASIMTDNGKLQNTLLMGINTKEFGETAWFKESLLSVHWYEYLNAISQNSRAILVSSNLRDKHGFKVGDVLRYTNGDGESDHGIIYGFVDYWPSYVPMTTTSAGDGTYYETDNYLVVAHLSQLQSSWGVTPYQVWIKTAGSTRFLYEDAGDTGVRYAMFQDASAELIALKNDPVFQGTNGILTIGFIIVLLLCATGFLIYWILSIQSRTLQFGIFRAMGMSQREVLSMLTHEQIFISGTSIGAGILVGMIGSTLFVPLIQIAYSAADKVIPLEIISEASDFIRLGVVVGAMLIICMVILAVLISKIKISQALKLGED